MINYLRQLDLRTFNPKAPPPRTEAWWAIVNANRAPEDAELSAVLERLGEPDAVTKEQLIAEASVDWSEIAEWLRDRRNARQVPHRMAACGYVPVRNEGNKRDGLWKVAGSWAAIYVKKQFTLADQLRVARTLVDGRRARDAQFEQEVMGGEGGDSGGGAGSDPVPGGR